MTNLIMNKERSLLLGILLLTHISLSAQSFNYEEQDTFFTDLQSELKKSFIECTGDTSVPELKYLLEWKNRIHLQTETEEYKKILKEYMIITGELEDIVPCHVLNWHKSRVKFLKDNEKRSTEKVLEDSDRIVDSIRYVRELKINPRSNYDFKNIPFGFTKKSFIKLYQKEYGATLEDYDTVLVSEHFLIKGTPFILRFYFHKDKRYYKYEIESYGQSGNDLNDKVRPSANMLKDQLELKTGSANITNRIGFFDIKKNKPSLYTLWSTEKYKAAIYYAIKNERYYTILKVMKKKIK